MQRNELVIGREYYIQPGERTYGNRVLARYCGERSQPHRAGNTVLMFQRIKTDGSAIEDTASVRGSVLLHSARWVTADRATYERQQAAAEQQLARCQAERDTQLQRGEAARDILQRATGLPFNIAYGGTRIVLDLELEVLARLLGE